MTSEQSNVPGRLGLQGLDRGRTRPGRKILARSRSRRPSLKNPARFSCVIVYVAAFPPFLPYSRLSYSAVQRTAETKLMRSAE